MFFEAANDPSQQRQLDAQESMRTTVAESELFKSEQADSPSAYYTDRASEKFTVHGLARLDCTPPTPICDPTMPPLLSRGEPRKAGYL